MKKQDRREMGNSALLRLSGGLFLKRCFFFACLTIFAAFPGIAHARSPWAPTLYGVQGYLDLFGSYRDEQTESNVSSLETKNTRIRERLTITGYGHIYHPRFIFYQLRVSAGLQENQDAGNSGPSPWRTASSNTFSISAIVLPEHPYNLSLWFTRGDTTGFTGISTITRSMGARAVYERQPYFGSASYTNITREYGAGSTTISTYSADASYYKKRANGKILTFLGTYRHTDSTATISDTSFSSDEASLSNTTSFGLLDIGSSVRWFSSDGGGSSASTWSWSEHAGLHLPYNFSAALAYSYSKSSTENDLAPDSNLSSTKNNANFTISHRLYKSLTTSYSLGYTKANTSTGDSNSLSNSFNAAYAKRIPWGSLNANMGLQKTDTDSNGYPATVDEAHPGVEVPGSFVLEATDVQPSTVFIYVINPDVPAQRVLLSPNVNYFLTPLGNQTEVDILSLPPEIAVHPSYDFFASYVVSSADAKFSVDNFYYNVRLSLFNDMLLPYYSHYDSRQTFSSDFVEEEDSEIITDNYGVQVRISAFTLVTEYTDVRSDVNPYKRWLASVAYGKSLTPTFSLRGAARYETTNYPEGYSGLGVAVDRTIASFSLGIAKVFPRYGLQFSLSGAYGRQWGLGESDSYTISSGLSWNVKGFSLTFGGSTSYSKSSTGVGTENTEFLETTTKRLSQYYFLSVSRRLF